MVRGQRLVLDSSTRPQPDALTNSEAFLAGISSCGVTLIEQHAQERGVPVKRLEVTIEGVRSAAAPNRFESISMHFTIAGVGQADAERRVDVAHLAATPEGMTVTVTVELTAVDRRRLTFRVEVHDEVEKVSEGTHERFVIEGAQRGPRLRAKLDAWQRR